MSIQDFNEFEDQLRRVRPEKVSQKVYRAIDSSIAEQKSRQRFAKWRSYAVWGGMAAAASITIVTGLSFFSRPAEINPEDPDAIVYKVEPIPVAQESQQEADFKPVLAQNNLRNRVDEGIVFLNNGLTARRYRYQFIDRVIWENPSNGAVVEMEIPRDEVVLIPVQTF